VIFVTALAQLLSGFFCYAVSKQLSLALDSNVPRLRLTGRTNRNYLIESAEELGQSWSGLDILTVSNDVTFLKIVDRSLLRVSIEHRSWNRTFPQ
jgi:hypothetical protein